MGEMWRPRSDMTDGEWREWVFVRDALMVPVEPVGQMDVDVPTMLSPNWILPPGRYAIVKVADE